VTVYAFLEEWDDLQRAARWPNGARIRVAMMLARDVETCEALLRGEPVDPARIDPNELGRASSRRLVRLDLAAIDALPAVTFSSTEEAAA
jgi:hypothetical protein